MGEAEQQPFRKIMDLCRWISIVLLLLHLYYYGYGYFSAMGACYTLTDRLLLGVYQSGFFQDRLFSSLGSVFFMILSLVGIRGKPEPGFNRRRCLLLLGLGLLFYFGAQCIRELFNAANFLVYIFFLVTGYIFILQALSRMSRQWKRQTLMDIFNHYHESFPQEERRIENEFSFHLRATYVFKGKNNRSWINIINPFRGTLVMGSPGSGKSYFIIQSLIRQQLQKGYCLFVYDFQYDDLSRIAYYYFQKYQGSFSTSPRFYLVQFDDLSRSHRCNPLEVSTLKDITDASESSRTIMMGLNRDWIRKQGDFFVESPINFVTALIWFLARYKKGIYCTLPHVIELAQVEYRKLFSVLRTESEIEVLINPFVSAFQHEAMEQLEGQIASAKISLGRLVSPNLYFVLTGSDFTLDINNPLYPKIVCMASNPQRSLSYGAVLSLYTTTLTRLVNKKGQLKSHLIFDEFPTLYFNGIEKLMATARSNLVATTLGIQDLSQLKMHYGREQSDVIFNLAGNILSGQVSGEAARQLSERFGKINQEKESVTINSTDTSFNHSRQLDPALPASRIASLSSGEFAGMVTDTPKQPIALKKFHARIKNDPEIERDQLKFKELPQVRHITAEQVQKHFYQVKKDIADLVASELERMMNSPELEGLIVS